MKTIEKLFDNIYFIIAFLSILVINKGESDIYEIVAIGFWALLALPLATILLFIIYNRDNLKHIFIHI